MVPLDDACARGPGIQAAVNLLADLLVDTLCCRIELNAEAEIERLIGRMRRRMHEDADAPASTNKYFFAEAGGRISAKNRSIRDRCPTTALDLWDRPLVAMSGAKQSPINLR